MSITYKVKTKAVNSKKLVAEICKFIEDSLEIVDFSSAIHRTSYIQLIDEFIEDKHTEDKITQWKIVCDNRNNTLIDFDRGNVTLDIYFKQKNCLNTTHINYQLNISTGILDFDFDL